MSTSPEIFFQQTPSPKGIEEYKTSLDEFISHNLHQQKRIALVTSGGTSIPLEKNTVRMLENFSSGNRGAKSAESFLDQGYAVIFLYRKKSKFPFTRELESWLEKGPKVTKLFTANGFSEEGKESIAGPLARLDKYQKARAFFHLPFITLIEYLFALKLCCQSLNKAGSSGLIYLAAAVSDFYLPPSQMAKHKIQSRDVKDGSLSINLPVVPKTIGLIRSSWSPKACLISFKLETDEAILVDKVQASFKYGQDIVIGNLLSSHWKEVRVFIRKSNETNNDPNKIGSLHSIISINEQELEKGHLLETKMIALLAKELHLVE